MLGAGWIGLTAGWLPRLGSGTGGNVAPRRRLLLLAVFGAVWGFLYGALLNLYFWPFAAPGLGTDAGLYWSPDLSFAETVARYARFYVVTSLGYDLFRAAGNAALVLALGGPILRTLERFRSRFSWEPWTDADAGEPTRAPRREGHEPAA
jgi:energy-coupling factor transport system substrate-specific component